MIALDPEVPKVFTMENVLSFKGQILVVITKR